MRPLLFAEPAGKHLSGYPVPARVPVPVAQFVAEPMQENPLLFGVLLQGRGEIQDGDPCALAERPEATLRIEEVCVA